MCADADRGVMQKKSINQFYLPVILTLALADLAIAGYETHGGHVVICQGQKPVVLDYYDSVRKTISGETPTIIDPEVTSPHNFVTERLKQLSHTSLSAQFHLILTQYLQEIVKPIQNWKNESVLPVYDSNLPYALPPNCKLVQAAARQSGQQYGNLKVINQLSNGQKEILWLHEALYAYLQDRKVFSPVPVRNFLNVFLNVNSTDLELNEAIFKVEQLVKPAEIDWRCELVCFSQLHPKPHNVIGYGSNAFSALNSSKSRCDAEKGFTKCKEVGAFGACLTPADTTNSCFKTGSIE
jgi:hypothetical protein